MCIKYLLYWVDNMALSFVYLCATQTLPPFFPISKHFLWATHGAEIVSGLAQGIVFKWSDSKGFSCRFKVHLYLCVCVWEREACAGGKVCHIRWWENSSFWGHAEQWSQDVCVIKYERGQIKWQKSNTRCEMCEKLMLKWIATEIGQSHV